MATAAAAAAGDLWVGMCFFFGLLSFNVLAEGWVFLLDDMKQ